jgi:prepilin-type processing-associated H-X9-DG protein
MGVIAVLAALLLPVVNRAREQSRRTACLSNLRTIGNGLYMYAQVHRDRLPNAHPANTWMNYATDNQVMVSFNDGWVKDPRVFLCPSDREAAVPDSIVTADQTLPNSARVSYEFFSLWWPPEAGPYLTKLKGRAPLAWDLDGGPRTGTGEGLKNHGKMGGNVLFADNHAQWTPVDQWEGESWPKPASEFYPAP